MNPHLNTSQQFQQGVQQHQHHVRRLQQGYVWTEQKRREAELARRQFPGQLRASPHATGTQGWLPKAVGQGRYTSQRQVLPGTASASFLMKARITTRYELDIYDSSNGELRFICRDDPTFMVRFFRCGAGHGATPLRMRVRDAIGQDVFTIDKPAGSRAPARVMSSSGVPVGRLANSWFSGLELSDESGRELARMNTTGLAGWKFIFQQNGFEIARVKRKRSLFSEQHYWLKIGRGVREGSLLQCLVLAAVMYEIHVTR